MEKYMLTTTDNPFNPFTQWDDWYFYDLSQGYNTCERIARIAKPGFVLPEELNDTELELAYDQLIFTGAISKSGNFVKYVKVENPKLKKVEKK